MSKVKVLTEEEIENIKNVREDFQILVNNVGDVEITIMNLNKRKKELEKKYGKGNISLETGEFTPIE